MLYCLTLGALTKIAELDIIIHMRIGLISDTHVPDLAKALPVSIMEAFRSVDLILHAGDIQVPSVLDDLEHIAPVLAASGDDDFGDVLRDKRVKEVHVLHLEGQTLWLIHQRPYSPGGRFWQSYSALRDIYEIPDIVVFGHWHDTCVSPSDGILYVNPGSLTFPRYRQELGTVGILTIDSGGPMVDILQL